VSTSASAGIRAPLARASGALRSLAGGAIRLGLAAAVGGALAWWALFRGLQSGDLRTAILVVGAVILAFPPVALGLFAVAARTMAALPGRLSDAPGSLRERTGEISRRASALAEARRRGGLRALPALARLWWSVTSARDLLQVVGPGAVLLTPATLVAAIAAVPGALLEILLGVVGLVWLAT
jgi:hypothetical protein